MDRRDFLKISQAGIVGLYGMSHELSLAQGLMPIQRQGLLLENRLENFAFGSCNQSTQHQGYWEQIAQCQPQLWVWLGDIIYGDGLSMTQRRKRYDALKNNQFYASFRSRVPVLGTWDDHDYAWNNQDGRFAEKLDSKKQLMEFLDIPADSGISGHSGIYQSYDFGPRGQRTKFVLLDLRYNQDRDRTERTLLGALQWQWLEQELARKDFDLLVIGSSINFSSEAVGWELEGWNAFPKEKARLETILTGMEQPILILSGDRHQAEFARWKTSGGVEVYELMSSGLTHHWFGCIPNQHRIGDPIVTRNFGMVEIDWSQPKPRLRLQIRSPQSGLVIKEIHSA